MSESFVSVYAIKGRGAATRLAHRFEREARAAFDDGWPNDEDLLADADTSRLQTELRWEDVRSVIVANDSPDIAFDYSINPYRGCEHGWNCYARPTHSYLGLSPGLDFETILIAKRNIEAVLRKELQRKSYVPKLLNIGSATDCYQPVERKLKLTRSVISILRDAHHPFSLITKSSGVERDLDLIAPMAAQHLAAVYVTITTLHAELTRKLEPRAASPQRRLRTIRTLHEAGIPVGVSVAPQISFINEDMEQVLEAARQAGARSAFYTVLRLPWELNELFQQWLQLHYPMRAERVMARIREMRHGKAYDSNFESRMKGSGLWAELIAQRFAKTCARLGFNRKRMELDLTQFRPGWLDPQRELF